MKVSECLDIMLDSPLVPLFQHRDVELCKRLMEICYQEGIRIFEFPNRLPEALDIFRQLKAYCDASLPGMLLGAGTIKNREDARKYLDAGADFLISPSIPPEVGEEAARRERLWIPGCATPTELNLAESLGISYVKIFPATSLGGPAFIKALRGPFPDLYYMASGGVSTDERELGEWFAAGVSSVALTSHLFRKDLLEEPGLDQLRAKVKITFSLLRTLARN